MHLGAGRERYDAIIGHDWRAVNISIDIDISINIDHDHDRRTDDDLNGTSGYDGRA